MDIELITVLGKRPAPDNTPDWVMESRLEKAISLLKESPAAKLVLQGGQSYSNKGAEVSEAQVNLNYLISKYQIDPQTVILEDKSQTTLEQAIILKEKFVLPMQLKSVALVTDEFHIKRAEIVFRGVMGKSIEVVSVPVEVKIYGKYRDLIARHESEDGLANLQKLVDTIPDGDHEAYKEYERKYILLRRQYMAEGKPRVDIIPVEEVLKADL